MREHFRAAGAGREFTIGGDRVVIKVSAADSGGVYSLMHWTFSPHQGSDRYGHVHARYEETFYCLTGEIDFYIGRDCVPMRAGDFVRVPPGVRHGLLNRTDQPVEMLVHFMPGGMEELFYKHRDGAGQRLSAPYMEEARDVHATVYGLPPEYEPPAR